MGDEDDHSATEGGEGGVGINWLHDSSPLSHYCWGCRDSTSMQKRSLGSSIESVGKNFGTVNTVILTGSGSICEEPSRSVLIEVGKPILSVSGANPLAGVSECIRKEYCDLSAHMRLSLLPDCEHHVTGYLKFLPPYPSHNNELYTLDA